MKKLKMTYQIIEKETCVNQKTFTRTVKNNSNIYNSYESEAKRYFKV